MDRHRTLPNCGGALKIIAAIEDPPVIVKNPQASAHALVSGF
jgi:hypothetical protein